MTISEKIQYDHFDRSYNAVRGGRDHGLVRGSRRYQFWFDSDGGRNLIDDLLSRRGGILAISGGLVQAQARAARSNEPSRRTAAATTAFVTDRHMGR
jgi:hypothetical protein